MAVGTDDQIAGHDNALFGQEGMFDTAVASLVIVGNPLLPGKLPDELALFSGADVLVGVK